MRQCVQKTVKVHVILLSGPESEQIICQICNNGIIPQTSPCVIYDITFNFWLLIRKQKDEIEQILIEA